MGAAVTYKKKQGGGWYVRLNDVKVGWAVKVAGEGWSFYSTTRPGFMGQLLTYGHRVCWEAVYEGLSHLSAYHGGRVCGFNHETLEDEVHYVGQEIKEAMEALLDAAYPKS